LSRISWDSNFYTVLFCFVFANALESLSHRIPLPLPMMLSSFSFLPVEFETFHPDSIAETSNKLALHVVESELSMQTFYSLEERK
jgi:hypothetical protein